jgi:Domain of unknown function (DUF4157)
MNLPESLETLIADSRAVVRYGYPWWLRPFLARDVIGFTLGRRVYLSTKVAGRSMQYVERLLRHELAHVRQMNRLTLPLFVVRYVFEYLVNLVRYRSFNVAYRRISFEIEATAAEERL